MVKKVHPKRVPKHGYVWSVDPLPVTPAAVREYLKSIHVGHIAPLTPPIHWVVCPRCKIYVPYLTLTGVCLPCSIELDEENFTEEADNGEDQAN